MNINNKICIKMLNSIYSKLTQGKKLSKNELTLLLALISYSISDLQQSDLNDK